MAQITAQLVNELRARSGQGMMECKKMLMETGGDVEKAIEGFRKKGIKTSVMERAAMEGKIVGIISADGNSGALVEMNCNTDFTAKSAPFLDLGQKAARLLLDSPSMNVGEAQEVKSAVTEVSQLTGENVRIGKTAYLSNPAGKVGMYLYGITGKIAVLVSVSGDATDDLFKDLGMHITARKPLALGLSREDVPGDIVAKEQTIAVEQAKATGKPQNLAEKIAQGKMQAFYRDHVLLEQEFINPDKFKGSVDQMLKAAGCKLEKYARLEVGQDAGQ
jgi:elongation factor Ts